MVSSLITFILLVFSLSFQLLGIQGSLQDQADFLCELQTEFELWPDPEYSLCSETTPCGNVDWLELGVVECDEDSYISSLYVVLLFIFLLLLFYSCLRDLTDTYLGDFPSDLDVLSNSLKDLFVSFPFVCCY